MKPEILSKIDTINREFYQKFADSFARSRQRLQPGVAKVLRQIPPDSSWLDVGCGTGSLAVEWIRQRRPGMYHGVDFSVPLIEEARTRLAVEESFLGMKVGFSSADLTDDNWTRNLPEADWDGLMMFAVLHHIAGSERRAGVLRRLHALIRSGAPLYVSVWQIQNSPRLMNRLLPWTVAGLDDRELEPGDALIDWRADSSVTGSSVAMRYVHLFSENELSGLAGISGFVVEDSFYSDGHEGNLGLYQYWRAVN
jgi:2-polyprenyl-3-methyl-5-hydroxy-6-metoxy-1,4-benzoquinol methylase